ncbi:MAG: lipocalin-like domain-containing protein [Burkholderiales bacterium]
MGDAYERLVGAWALRDWRTDYSDGRAATRPFGLSPEGLLTYTACGHMLASIQLPTRTLLSAESARHAPADQKVAAFDGFLSYGGTFEVAGATLTHRVTIAHNPNLIGTTQVRQMRFADRSLTLMADDRLPGTDITRHHALTWERL